MTDNLALSDLPQPTEETTVSPDELFELDEENYRDVIERRIGEAKRQREASVNQEKPHE